MEFRTNFIGQSFNTKFQTQFSDEPFKPSKRKIEGKTRTESPIYHTLAEQVETFMQAGKMHRDIRKLSRYNEAQIGHYYDEKEIRELAERGILPLHARYKGQDTFDIIEQARKNMDDVQSILKAQKDIAEILENTPVETPPVENNIPPITE